MWEWIGITEKPYNPYKTLIANMKDLIDIFVGIQADIALDYIINGEREDSLDLAEQGQELVRRAKTTVKTLRATATQPTTHA